MRLKKGIFMAIFDDEAETIDVKYSAVIKERSQKLLSNLWKKFVTAFK